MAPDLFVPPLFCGLFHYFLNLFFPFYFWWIFYSGRTAIMREGEGEGCMLAQWFFLQNSTHFPRNVWQRVWGAALV